MNELSDEELDVCVTAREKRVPVYTRIECLKVIKERARDRWMTIGMVVGMMVGFTAGIMIASL